MEPAQPQGLLGLLVMIATSLVVVVYVFLRMVGVFGHRHGSRERRGFR